MELRERKRKKLNEDIDLEDYDLDDMDEDLVEVAKIEREQKRPSSPTAIAADRCDYLSCNDIECAMISMKKSVLQLAGTVWARKDEAILADSTFDVLHELGQKIQLLLKPSNDPAHSCTTARVFYPAAMFSCMLKPLFESKCTHVTSTNSSEHFVFEALGDFYEIIDQAFLRASWPGKGIVAEILCSDEYPLRIKYTKASRTLNVAFSFKAYHSATGVMVLTPIQKIAESPAV